MTKSRRLACSKIQTSTSNNIPVQTQQDNKRKNQLSFE
jgi:hypothetical protein